MCGFIGFTTYLEDQQKKRDVLQRMMNRIVHRGPDMADSYIDQHVALGFRRLSIIDLSQGACQPMTNENGEIVLVFNGEIYNFQSLRKELIEQGHTFRTETDSEVLVHGYEAYGTKVLDRLRGMFSFVIYDKRRGRIFGARDIFGIKPHYYTILSDGSLMFGSEIKSFLEHPLFQKEVNPNALRAYLTFQYSAGNETFFKNVYKLPQGCYYIFENGTMQVHSYWDPVYTTEEKSEEEWTDIVDQTVHESVAAHQISDVPVGSFLSGGVDSSYITAVLHPNNTFSVGFEQNGDKRFNETTYAQELSKHLGIHNITKMITPEECFAAFPDIQYHMDEPQSNPSCVPLWFLAKLAREHVTVVLSGEGADELFAGYDWYADTKEVRTFKKYVPACVRHALSSIVKPLPKFKGRSFLLRASGRPEDYFIGQALVFSDKEALECLKPNYQKGSPALEMVNECYARVNGKDELTKKQYLDMHLWLPGDILLKADKMSMAHSLELRVPFLDKVVMECAEKIPSKYKVNDIDTKYILRRAANRNLPHEWATRKKQGFPVPIRYWLREKKYYELVKSYFTADYAAKFFVTEKIVQLLDDHYSGRHNNGRKIWTVFTFLVWYRRFFIDDISGQLQRKNAKQ